MASHTPVKPDQQQIERAEDMWGNFTSLLTASIIASVLVLIVLAGGFYLIWR